MSLYGIIADLRREHTTSAASKTLDMVVFELGRSRDNLRLAVERLEVQSLPPGGKPILEDLVERARRAGVDDLSLGPAPDEIPEMEPLDQAQVGIGALLGLSSLVAVGLAAVAVLAGLNAIFHFF